MKSARSVTLTSEERRTLLRWSRGRSTPARQVLRAKIVLLAAEGLMNQEIAEQLFLSVRTVETHRAHIMQKLRISTRAELVRYALSAGLMDEAGGA